MWKLCVCVCGTFESLCGTLAGTLWSFTWNLWTFMWSLCSLHMKPTSGTFEPLCGTVKCGTVKCGTWPLGNLNLYVESLWNLNLFKCGTLGNLLPCFRPQITPFSFIGTRALCVRSWGLKCQKTTGHSEHRGPAPHLIKDLLLIREGLDPSVDGVAWHVVPDGSLDVAFPEAGKAWLELQVFWREKSTVTKSWLWLTLGGFRFSFNCFD